MQSVMIHTMPVGQGHPCFVVCDIGAMYENMEGMKALIKAMSIAGADAVKIQTYTAQTLALPGATFQLEDGTVVSQYDFFKKHEISHDDHKELFAYAAEIGITLFSTPSHYEDVDFLDSLGVPVFKTGSDDLTNYPFLEYMAKKGKPIIVSTGMASLGEVEEAIRTILKTGNDQVILLHCTTSYPPQPHHINLKTMNTLRSAFDLPVGYSDHRPDTLASLLAASMGACMIERHVTLDRKMKRPDYQVASEPKEIKQLVDQVRTIPLLLGNSVKQLFPSEQSWCDNARKSLVAARDIRTGEVLSRDDIRILRPGTGIHPRYLNIILGRQVRKNIAAHELISLDSL